LPSSDKEKSFLLLFRGGEYSSPFLFFMAIFVLISNIFGVSMPSISLFQGLIQENLSNQFAAFAAQSIVTRIWEKDHTVWRSEEIHKKSILTRLGWLHSIDLMTENADALTSFASEIRNSGFQHVVVLGMGGSSLCPDVCRATFGSAPGFPNLLVLDSTNPTSVLRIEKQIDLATTLFIVASKSGGTTETNMFFQYFYDRVASVQQTPGDNFIAITDAHTKMEAIAAEKKFRKIFVNPADIGGRYSALSYFGLVPMALIGMDVKTLLHSADEMRKQCRFEGVQNPGAELGMLMGEAHNEGMDKLTLVMSHEISTFAYWAEQLIAESTGKEGKGILPIEGELLPAYFDEQRYGDDRIFVFIVLEKDVRKHAPLMNDLRSRGIPHASVVLKDINELGSQFFLWEFATAVSAVVLKINPFDEPNVKESKDNTVQVIDEYNRTGTLPRNAIAFEDRSFQFFTEQSDLQSRSNSSMPQILSQHCSGVRGEDYIAVLAYVDQNSENERLLGSLRERLSAKTGLPVTVGFGPRYLHSTGQLHKGGKPNGIFVIITADEPADAAIPGEQYTFEVLKNAQALGDYRSFAQKKIRMIHIHFRGGVPQGLKELTERCFQ
jgi:glucose-6-phosphate isomerase